MSKYFKSEPTVVINKKISTRSRSKKQKVEENNNEEEQSDTSTQPGTINTDSVTNSTESWEPKNWKEILENIRKMRVNEDAPVDSVGCERSYDENASPKLMRFQVLVSLMLSSQTKDEINHAAMVRLRKRGLSPEMIIEIDDDELGELLKPVGFWRRKTEYLKKVSQILIEKYNGDIPPNFTELCELPGVGPKMAHLVMQVAWDEITGIAVDTHVHRIANRLEWVKKNTKDPIATERELEDWIPRCLWNEINHLLVGFGQTICKPIGPKCQECLNRNICPSSSVTGKGKAKGKGRKVKSSDQV